MDIREIVREVERNNGGTFSVSSNGNRFMFSSKIFDKGFWVGTGIELEVDELNASTVATFINEHLSAFGIKPGKGTRQYLGLWKDNDSWCIELSEHFFSRIEAMEAMKDRNQRAIFDIANSCEIRNKRNFNE